MQITQVSGKMIGLGPNIILIIFRLPERKRTVDEMVERRLNAAENPITFDGFGPEAVCSNGYKLQMCTSDEVMDRLKFQRYALHMHKNRAEVSTTHVF